MFGAVLDEQMGLLTDWFEVVIIKFVHCDTVLEIYHFNPRSYHKIF